MILNTAKEGEMYANFCEWYAYALEQGLPVDDTDDTSAFEAWKAQQAKIDSLEARLTAIYKDAERIQQIAGQ